MVIDLSQFVQIFFEETAEHIAGMESMLLALDASAADQEKINAIFRAAHSIKGSAGAFGIADLEAFAHALENLLDTLRKGDAPLCKETIDALLEACDVLRAMLAAHQGKGVGNAAATEAVRRRLGLLSAGEVAVDLHGDAPVEPVAGEPAAGAVASAETGATSNTAALAASPASAAAMGGALSLRIGMDKVDHLINLVGELLITQSMLVQSSAHLDAHVGERLHKGMAQLQHNSRELRQAVMSLRMTTLSTVFSRFPRLVRDISTRLGKQVELRLRGGDVWLDKGLAERIVDPLTHLVRNSLDHGVEAPPARIAAGKAPCGVITLAARRQGGGVLIEISDDGAGLDRDAIIAVAQRRGLPVHERMSDQQVFALIFEAGFSTAANVSEVSGRGVGMDVVRQNINALGGRVDIDSVTGVGALATVRLPLTLAIVDGMSATVGDYTYIIPLDHVIESLQPAADMMASDEHVLHLRDERLPVVRLYELFAIENAQDDLTRGVIVVLEADGERVALLVDALTGQHQVVVKDLQANYRKVSGVGGATILGDGDVVLILDAAALVRLGREALPAAA